jgi:prevent-host-death family protein
MVRRITPQELGDQSDEIVQAVEDGESFVVTRDGVPVGRLVPIRPRRFVPTDEAQAAFAGLPRIDAKRFREDVDAILDQDPNPRA